MFRQVAERFRAQVFGTNIAHNPHDAPEASATNFENLIEEVQFEIFSKLNLKDLLILASVSTKFNSLANDNKLWEKLFKQYYSDAFKRLIKTPNIRWKEEFKKKFMFYYYDLDLSHLADANMEKKIVRKKIIMEISKLILLGDINKLKLLKKRYEILKIEYDDPELQYEDLMIEDQYHDSLFTLAAKINDQAILDYFYQIARNRFRHRSYMILVVDPLIKDDNNYTILHLAAMCNRSILEIEMLLKPHRIEETKCDLNAIANNGATPLYIAVQHGRLDIARALLAHGADPNLRLATGATALHTAVENGELEMVKLLLSFEASVNTHHFESGMTPFHSAVENGEHKIAKRLLLAGADINAPHLLSGATPLHTAVENRDERMVNLLLTRYDLDVNATQKNGATPLLLAVENNYLKISFSISSYKVNWNYKTNLKASLPDGRTALYIAAENGYVEIAKFLITIYIIDQKAIDLNKSLPSGATPASIAAENGHTTIVEELLKAKNLVFQSIAQRLNDFIMTQRTKSAQDNQSENPNTFFSPKDAIKAAKALRRVIFKGADESILEKHKEVVADSELKNLYWGFRR